jgi:S-formylglutathione hydrolase FrmB
VRAWSLVLLPLTACSSNSAAPPASSAPTSPAAVPTRRASPSRVVGGTFRAPSLGVDKNYVVYLPAGYDESRRSYPVIYMLHGLSGTEWDWEKLGELGKTADRLALQSIVVMPDGDNGFYVNWASPVDYDACLQRGNAFPGETPENPVDYCVKSARYEDYIARDLVSHIDATYRTVRDRKGRAIGGLSMGGSGALMLAMRRKDLFSSAASHSGSLVSLFYVGPHPYEPGKAQLAPDMSWWIERTGAFGKHVVGLIGTDLRRARSLDPTTMAAGLKDRELAIYLDCGTDDRFRLQDAAQYLHEQLDKAGVKHAWYLGSGGHDWDFWKQRIDDSLAFHVEAFKKAGVY